MKTKENNKASVGPDAFEKSKATESTGAKLSAGASGKADVSEKKGHLKMMNRRIQELQREQVLH